MKKIIIMLAVCSLWLSVTPTDATAHCDTLQGPVVSDARAALESGTVSPVLKWVRENDEQEIRDVFQKVLIARKANPQAKEIADRYFFETLVRIHRAGEGAPYAGLKEGPPEPIIAEADRALQTGSAETIVKEVTAAVSDGIKKRFAETLARKKHAAQSVQAGRDFVAAYVDFTHYVERLHTDAMGSADTHGRHETEKANGGHDH